MRRAGEGPLLLANLQALRALAALGVVAFHFGLMPATSLPFAVGASGVDLFFVLSGFIIAYSSAASPRHFLANRLIRVLPAYWVVTLIAALFTLQSLDLAAAADWLVQSLFYLPHPAGRPPLIFVAWTLVYELGFYLLFWCALSMGVRAAPIACLPLLIALALVDVPGVPGPWPLLLEFAMGIGIFVAVERYRPASAVPPWVGLLAAASGLVMLPVFPSLTGYRPDDYASLVRVVCWGLPSALIVWGLVTSERGGFALRNKLVLLLGAASYSIYLLHSIAVGQLMQLPPVPAPLSWALSLAAIGVTAAISIAFHRIVEVPLLRSLRGLLRERLPVEQRIIAR